MSPASARTTTMSDEDLAVLRRAPLFDGVETELVEQLLPHFAVAAAGRGSVIFEENDLGDDLFVVLEGRVSLSLNNQGNRQLLAVLDPGDMFGELSLFDPGPRTTQASALLPTRLAVAHREDVLAWATNAPPVAARLLQVLARRLRRSNSTVRDLVFVDVPGRLARVLLELADRYGEPGPDGAVIEHGLTQQQLAELTGSSRETVNKALAGFTQRGWLALRPGGRFVLLDAERLRRRGARASDET